MILIIASLQDPAGINIANNILEHYDFEKIGDNIYLYSKNDACLTFIKERTIFADFIERNYHDVKANFFITRHSSKEGVNTLTTHTPGNFKEALYGGKEGYLCKSNPIAQKLALISMFRQNEEMEMKYEVSLEATHHGPQTSVPTTFFEIGSALEQWKDIRAGEIVARATMGVLDYAQNEFPKAIGVGGGHYPKKFTDLVINTEWSIGHIIPKYIFPIDKTIINETLQNNDNGNVAIFDWKGTPKRSLYKELFESLNCQTFKTKDLVKSVP